MKKLLWYFEARLPDGTVHAYRIRARTDKQAQSQGEIALSRFVGIDPKSANTLSVRRI